MTEDRCSIALNAHHWHLGGRLYGLAWNRRVYVYGGYGIGWMPLPTPSPLP